MSWTFCTSGAALMKAGANASSVIRASGAELAQWYDEAEGKVIAETRRDWKGSATTITSGAALALSDCISDLIGIKIINYDTSGFPTTANAQLALDVLYDNANKNINVLKDFKSNDIKSPV